MSNLSSILGQLKTDNSEEFLSDYIELDQGSFLTDIFQTKELWQTRTVDGIGDDAIAPNMFSSASLSSFSWDRAPFSSEFPGQVELLPNSDAHLVNPIVMCGCVACGGTGTSVTSLNSEGQAGSPFNAIVNGYESLLYQGGGWNGATAGKAVFLTYSFELTPASYLADIYTAAGLGTFVAFNAAWQDLTRAALNDWASISGITFFEAPAGQGELTFGSYDLGSLNQPNAGGFAYVPFGINTGVASGDVFIRNEYINADPNSWTWYKHLMLHEIGHALGLKHPFDSSPNLPTETDNYTNTVMSYTSGGAPGNVLGPIDVQAIQYLYGTNSNDGTNVSAWNWNAASAILSQTGFSTADSMLGTPGSDSINSGDGNDTIAGRGGSDTIDAGNGDDSVTIRALNVTTSGSYIGGAGTDSIQIYVDARVGAVATIDLAASGGLAISQFESITVFGNSSRSNNIQGGANAEYLYGNNLADTLSGGDGNDTIYAFGGDDLVSGGNGNDYLFAYAGSDTLSGGEGNDTLQFDVSSLSSILSAFGDAGNDRVLFNLVPLTGVSLVTFNLAIGGVGSNLAALNGIERVEIIVSRTTAAGDITGGDGQEYIYGNELADTIRGGLGADYLVGRAGNDSLDGGAGMETIYGEAGADSLYGGDDVDQLIADNASDPAALQGNDFADCGAGNDTAWTYGGDDTLFGGAGNDNLDGGTGADTFFYLDGASGADNIYGFVLATDFFNLSGKSFTAASVQGSNTLLTWANGTMFVVNVAEASIANWNARLVAAGNPASELLYGTETVDVMFGGGGDDTMNGLAGNDTLNGGDGNDVLDGSLGLDVLNGDAGADTIIGATGDILDGGTGIDAAVADRSGIGANQNITLVQSLASFLALSGATSATGIEIFGVRTGDGADTLVGTAVADYFGGGGGNDFFTAGDGADTVSGGSGNDMIILGGGNDVGYADGNTGQDYLYAGAGDDLIVGGAGALDILLGEDGNDTLRGGDGLDYLIGGTGNNQLWGEGGDDVFLSGGASDTMSGGDGHNYFYRISSGISSIIGGIGIDEFVGGLVGSDDSFSGGDGQDYGYGGTGNDVLVGGAGGDVLIGQIGDDTLEGGAGINLLWANDAGNDQIRVNVADGGTQVVEFFEAGGSNDVLRLLGSSLTSFAGIQNLVTNIGVAQGANLMVNASSGAQLYLSLGANQTAIWFQGVSAYSLTSADFLFG